MMPLLRRSLLTPTPSSLSNNTGSKLNAKTNVVSQSMCNCQKRIGVCIIKNLVYLVQNGMSCSLGKLGIVVGACWQLVCFFIRGLHGNRGFI